MDKEKFCLENFPTSESAKRQLSYVSADFYENSYVGKWLYQVMGQEYDDARKIIEELPLQMFPETATWGLMYHEVKWGLPVRQNLSYEERRRLIYEKRDFRAPMTPYRMEKYLEDVTGFEVHIADIHDPGEYGFAASHPNVFKAYFLGEETLDSKLVHKILNRLKQSHTTYTVNERIEAVFDNWDLEQIILRNIRFKMGLPFWYEYVYNGGWLLDGSVMLDSKRRYGLVLGMEHRQSYYMQEHTKLVSVGFLAGVLTEGLFTAGAECRFRINFWNALCFDGLWFLDGSVMLNSRYQAKLALDMHSEMDFSGQEAVDNLTVQTKTRDYRFLDGSFCLDGDRNLNSIYRQEVIE